MLTNQQQSLVSGLGAWTQKMMDAEQSLREISRIIGSRNYEGLVDQDLVDSGFDFTLADIGAALAVLTQIETLLSTPDLVGSRSGYEILDVVRLYQY